MATNAATQGTVFALRRQIAKIEGRLAERLEERSGEAAAESDIVLRQHGIAVPAAGCCRPASRIWTGRWAAGCPRPR
ncbi:MAG: hypothetical protein KJ796_12945 [Alphaproteobacteria bacterium]|nr:hypothetical protein [Alphaproteobacteria bacterium]